MILFGMYTFTPQQIQEIRDLHRSPKWPCIAPAWYVALASAEQAELILKAHFIDLFEITSRAPLNEPVALPKIVKNIN